MKPINEFVSSVGLRVGREFRKFKVNEDLYHLGDSLPITDIQLYGDSVLIWCKIDNRHIPFCPVEIMGGKDVSVVRLTEREA